MTQSYLQAKLLPLSGVSEPSESQNTGQIGLSRTWIEPNTLTKAETITYLEKWYFVAIKMG